MSEKIMTKLPKQFEEYVNSKLENGKKGRKHLVNQLGSMEKVLELLADAWIEQLDPKAICKKYAIGYYQFYRFLKDVEQYKEQIIAYINYIEEVKPKNFRSYAIVQEWEAKIRRSGHLSQLNHIRTLERICQGKIIKSFRCSPNKFDLQKAQEFVDKYLKEYNVKKLPRHLRMAIRHFLMVARNINIPRGYGSLYGLSGEKDNFGIYRYVRFTDEQIEEIREYLKNKNDLEALTFFDWGIESLARASTIAKTRMLDFQQEDGIVTIAMYETKTDRSFQKFLLLNIPHAKETWEEIKELGKNREYLFFDKKPTKSMIKKFLQKLSPRLKEAYRYANVQHEYAYKKPFHVLRHAGAHLWLMRSNYDYGLVAEMGWEDINTLRQVYGGMPKEILRRKISQIQGE